MVGLQDLLRAIKLWFVCTAKETAYAALMIQRWFERSGRGGNMHGTGSWMSSCRFRRQKPQAQGVPNFFSCEARRIRSF